MDEASDIGRISVRRKSKALILVLTALAVLFASAVLIPVADSHQSQDQY